MSITGESKTIPAKPVITHYRRLPLQGMINTRELGGFAAENGKVTKYGRFLRSEVPDTITGDDIAYLLKYGVTMDVDLRGSEELRLIHNLLDSVDGIDYRHVPSFQEQSAAGAGVKQHAPFVSWGVLYTEIVDRSPDWVKKCMEAFAECTGCCIYNCTTGKDRTGIITAMLLGLAGVPYEEIIADYCVSEVYMRSKYIALSEKMPPMPGDFGGNREGLNAPFFRTLPDNMRMLLEHLDQNYGGIPAYLRSCGLSEEVLQTVKAKLLD